MQDLEDISVYVSPPGMEGHVEVGTSVLRILAKITANVWSEEANTNAHVPLATRGRTVMRSPVHRIPVVMVGYATSWRADLRANVPNTP